MSEPTKIESHYEEAKDLLPSQFYDKPYINAHLQALADQCQEVEDLFYDDIYTDKMFVNATGTNLEEIGELYNVRRVLGESDETLRRNIGAEILRRNSEGTQGSVKSILSAFTGLTNMRVFEHSVGCPIIFGETLDESYELSGDEAQYIKDAAPITTGSCVFGVSYSSEYSSAIIPAELDLTYYNLVVDGDCRYYFNFAGDGYVETTSRWDPDATDPSFVLEFYNDLTIEGTTYTQFEDGETDYEISIVSTSTEFQVGVCGNVISESTTTDDEGLKTWRFEFNGVDTCLVYRDNTLRSTLTVSIGTIRHDSPNTYFMGRAGANYDSEILADVRLWVNGSTTDTGTLVLDMPIEDNSTSIKDYAPSESGVLDVGSGEWIAVEGTGYQFDFNGDGKITFPRMWEPDAVDPSFTVEFYNDISIPKPSIIIAQSIYLNGDYREFSLETGIIDDRLSWRLGGDGGFFSTTTLTEGLYKVEYINSTETMNLYVEGILHESKTATIGLEREPDTSLTLGELSSDVFGDVGVLSDVKMWINTESTNDLVLDAPINDNSNTIVNYAERVSGTLTEGTGYWEEICESEEKNLVTGSISESKNIVVRKSSDTLTESSADSQNAQLAEFTVTTAQMSVDLEDGTTDLLSINSDGNYLKVSYEGIENDRGVPLNTTQITIDSSVADIQAAFNVVAP